MIILDTNVISQVIRPYGDMKVVDWLDTFPQSEVFLTSITAAELQFGAASMPNGRRRDELFSDLQQTVDGEFLGRVLPFTVQAAPAYGEIVTTRKNAGLPIATADALIAAICRSHQAILATRNIKDFVSTGIQTVNPWD